MGNKRLALVFVGPGQVTLQDELLEMTDPGSVLVQTYVSGISAGTELLIYRGQFPGDMALDENIPALAGEFRYPLRYGYAAVGRVIDIGPQADPSWAGKLVFSFHPHASHFWAAPQNLLEVPDDISQEEAIFLPNMETAVNFVMDGRPLLGEDVVVFGQGVVGLLTTALLGWFPLRKLVTLDRYARRRAASLELGAHASLESAEDRIDRLYALLPTGADLVFELSGSPAVLEDAITAAGFTGRVVVGSWYGQKRAPLDLGGHFHRSRIQLISSQVSTLAPELSGRWNKPRRFQVAWEMIRRLRPSRLITHHIPLNQATDAYRLLDQQPEETIQVVLEYDR